MKTSLLASLESAIQSWMDKSCEKSDWPNMWVYADLAKDMASAAAAIIDACEKSQLVAKEFDNEH